MPTQNLRRLQQQQLMRTALGEIATLVRSLTYGEMMELSEGIYKGSVEGSAVTQQNLPVLLYCWSISRSTTIDNAL
jgi:hypothetical protein